MQLSTHAHCTATAQGTADADVGACGKAGAGEGHRKSCVRGLGCRYAMDNVDWAMNAAQINRDIRLANEHLPPEMQVWASSLLVGKHCAEVTREAALPICQT